MTSLPQINGERLIRALGRDGWSVVRTRGSHHVLRNPGSAGLVHVPVHSQSIKRGTLAAILKQANMTAERLKELM